MKKCIYLILQLLLLQSVTNAQRVFISGKLKSDLDSIDIKVSIIRTYISGSEFERQNIPVNLNKAGKVTFVLNNIKSTVRISIQDKISGIMILDNAIVEPLDNIYFESTMRNGICKTSFYGRGASKYKCNRELKQMGKDPGYFLAMNCSEILFRREIDVLDRNKKWISPVAYQIMKGDVVGNICMNILGYRCGETLYDSHVSESDKFRTQAILDSLKASLIDVDGHLFDMSINYIAYQYNKSLFSMIVSRGGLNFNFREFYLFMRQNYSGRLREKVLAFALLNSSGIQQTFFGCDAQDYNSCLLNAILLVQNSNLKKMLRVRLATRGKGAMGFKFILPADSSLRRVRMADLRGKVLLIDMWGYSCTACHDFSEVFHEKIYPNFKNDSNFLVISIMIDNSTRNAYMRRLRGDGTVSYTYSDYINLFGGQGVVEGNRIRAHYGIDALPLILLIDKEGKIWSSTVPFFLSQESTKIKALSELITEALCSSSKL